MKKNEIINNIDRKIQINETSDREWNKKLELYYNSTYDLRIVALDTNTKVLIKDCYSGKVISVPISLVSLWKDCD